MRYNHAAISVSDIDRALTLYRDLLGLHVVSDAILPDDAARLQIDPDQLSESMRVADARARVVALRLNDTDESFLELLELLSPSVRHLPCEFQHYWYTGIKEVAFSVTDVDSWFGRVKAAGYTTQTRAVWSAGGVMRSFIFHDGDANRIQLVEQTGSLG